MAYGHKLNAWMVSLAIILLAIVLPQTALAEDPEPMVVSGYFGHDYITGELWVHVNACCSEYCGPDCSWYHSAISAGRVPRGQVLPFNEPTYLYTEWPNCNHYFAPKMIDYSCVGDEEAHLRSYTAEAYVKCFNVYSDRTPISGGLCLDHRPSVHLSVTPTDDPEIFVGDVQYFFPQSIPSSRQIRIEWISEDGSQTQHIGDDLRLLAIPEECPPYDYSGNCRFVVREAAPEGMTKLRVTAWGCKQHEWSKAESEDAIEPSNDEEMPNGETTGGEDPEEEKDRCGEAPQVGKPVRLTNGNMRATDAEPLPAPISGAGDRTYDSINAESGAFGLGWTSLFDARVVTHGGDLYEVIKEGNNSVFFRRPHTFSRQEWPLGSPAGKLSRSDLSDPNSPYVYTTPDGDTVRTYRGSDGKLVSIESKRSQDGVFIAYNVTTGHPETVSDANGNVLWTVLTDAGSGRVLELRTGNAIWTYIYSVDRLDEVRVDGITWRVYSYNADDLLTEIADGEGHAIEQHDYYPMSDPDHPGWAQTSRSADEHITDIAYHVDQALLDRQLNTAAGEYAARVTHASGLYTDYYIRPTPNGRHRVAEIRGNCTCPGAGEFTLSALDSRGRKVRKQDARGYISTWTYDHSNRVVKEERGIAPPACDPETDPDQCRYVSPDELYAADLSAAWPEATVIYTYDDPNWPNKRTSICRESVVEAGQTTCRNFKFDAVTGIAVESSISGWEWDRELDASVWATRTSTTTLYDGVVTAVFDPTAVHGGLTNFTSPMAAEAQPAGQLMQTQGPLADSSDLVQYVYYPDAAGVPAHLIGRLAARKDPGNLVTVYDDYDLLGNAVRVIDPRGVATSFDYNVLGQLESTTLEANCAAFPDDPLCDQDLITTYDYATNGNLVSTISPGGAATSYGYDSWSRRTSVKRGPTGQDPLEQIEYSLDPASGRQLDETTSVADGAAWTPMRRVDSQYNDYGRLTRLERPVSATDPNPAAELYEYDRAGNLVEFTDPLHASANVKYTYDALGRLAQVEQLAEASPESWAITEYEYDTHGNLVKVTDANGNETSYWIDDFGRTYAISSPVTGVSDLKYNEGGRLVETVDDRGVTETRLYDSHGRLDSVTYDEGGSTVVVHNIYNGFGQRVRADVLTGSVTTSTQTWDFDRRGAVLIAGQEIGGGEALTMTHGYDLDGNLVTRTRGCEEIGYELDFAGRPIRVTGAPSDCSGAQIVFADDIRYLPFGPIASMRRGDVEETFGYDWQYRLRSQTADLAMPSLPGPIGISGLGSSGIGMSAQSSRIAAFADRTYDYDAAGNLVGVIDLSRPQRTRTYTYDDLGRLETTHAPHSFGQLDYEYDLIGNRTQKSFGVAGSEIVTDYTYDTNAGGLNTPLLSSIDVSPPGSSYPLSHDSVGNLLTDESSSYTYTPRNNLASQSTGGTERFNFLYDADGIRIRTNGSDPVGSFVDHYLGIDGRPAYEVVDDGATITERSFVYLGGRLLARFDQNGNVENLISDHIGYPLATFEFDGDLLWEAEALPFGEVNQVFQGDETTDPLLRYPGQWALDAIGGSGNTSLYYNQHRWYRAEWGRYTQADPLGLRAGINLFQYSRSNPLRWIDLLGLESYEGFPDKNQEDFAREAVGRIRDRLEDDCACPDSEDLVNLLDDLTIEYNPELFSGFGRTTFRNYWRNRIEIAPMAMDPGSGCRLATTIIHEMAHLLSLWNWLTEGRSEEIDDQCFPECTSKVPVP